MNRATITRLEKVATDNGFDRERSWTGDWLAFASTQAPLRIWLTAGGDGSFVAAFSQRNVYAALETGGAAGPPSLPEGACGARTVDGVSALHHLVRRAFQLSRTLPDELLHVFEAKTHDLPKATEAERLVVQRVGQDVFRHGLLDYWEGRCSVTGLAVPELLRASHIKPWADCATDAERLDVYNGLLLAPHLDAAFDRGFVTAEDDGKLRVSPRLAPVDRELLGLNADFRIQKLADGHREYLPWHREHVFQTV